MFSCFETTGSRCWVCRWEETGSPPLPLAGGIRFLLKRWSPTMGIMRLLMDHWHVSSFKDVLLCAKRVTLQVRSTLFWNRSDGRVYTSPTQRSIHVLLSVSSTWPLPTCRQSMLGMCVH